MSIIKIKDASIGDVFVTTNLKFDGQFIDWVIVHKYKDGSVVLMSKYILSIKPFDSIERDTKRSKSERLFGSNDYKDSNVRKWLNTNGECHWEYDDNNGPYNGFVTCNGYDKELGFLTSFNSSFIDEYMLPTKIPYNDTYLNDVVFLPSENELGVDINFTDKRIFDYFKKPFSKKRRIAFPLDKAIERTDIRFGKEYPECDEYHPWTYLTRTPDKYATISECRLSIIDEKGKLGGMFAYNGSGGIRPCITINGNLTITRSDEFGIDFTY